jgi:hypothetical protein
MQQELEFQLQTDLHLLLILNYGQRKLKHLYVNNHKIINFIFMRIYLWTLHEALVTQSMEI